MSNKTAKPLKFPKKFRMKLEKMAAGRERQAEERAKEEKAEGILTSLFDTLYRAIIPTGSVHLMHSKVEDNEWLGRITTRYSMQPAAVHSLRVVPPPWEGKPERPASS